MRLFVAVELSEPARERVTIGARRRDEWPPASWVRKENLHLTLTFLGEVESAAAARLAAALRRRCGELAPFEARLDGAGAFPPWGDLRVLWLGVEPAAQLTELARFASEACGEIGLASDERAFAPHLTLARCRPPWDSGWRARLGRLAPPEPVGFEVGSVAVLASQLGAAGLRYSRQAEVRLGAAA